jgi:tRNA threonylcarbamoyladenosine biosynthesis protein TsaE
VLTRFILSPVQYWPLRLSAKERVSIGMKQINFRNETELLAYAARLSTLIEPPCVIFLSGILGAGKTTFVRGFLQGLGFKGAVKSPTFTLVEDYLLQDKLIYHFDVYRIRDPEELEWMGIRDYFERAILLVEWPERAEGYLPQPDLHWRLEMASSGRNLILEAASHIGQRVLANM